MIGLPEHLPEEPARDTGAILPIRETEGAPTGLIIQESDVSNAVMQPTEHTEFIHKIQEVNERLLLSALHEQERSDEAQHYAAITLHQALHDTLTGLPNRDLLIDRMEQAMKTATRTGNTVALLFLDLDGFKAINDRFGHHSGDVVLQQVGARITTILRKADSVARLGGDEFAVLLFEVTSAGDTLGVARKIIEVVAQPFVINTVPHVIRLSIGIALYPDHGTRPETLLHHADMAMYVAKRAQIGYAMYGEPPGASGIGETQTHLAPRLDLRSVTERLILSGLREQEETDHLGRQLTATEAILHGLDDGIYILDAEERFTFVNAAAERLLGVTERELLGKDQKDAITFRHSEESDTPARLSVNTGPMNLAFDNDGLLCLRKDGTTFPVAYAATSMVLNGALLGTIVAFRDVTALHVGEQERHSVLHDPLTGLPNRGLFVDRLYLALERQRRSRIGSVAVLFLNLSGFAHINDASGYRAGIEILVEAARRLQASVRVIDTVARFGNDQFALLLEDPNDHWGVERVVARIQQALSMPFQIAYQTVAPIVNMGVAVTSAQDTSPEDMIRDANSALDRAKAAGAGCFVAFDTAMHTRVITQLHSERDLRQALLREEFRIVYQPVVSLVTHMPVAFEALVRWQHPQHGLLLPDTFIPLMEEMGLIVQLDEWVLRHACQQLLSWQRAVPTMTMLGMNVNVSSQHFLDPNLAEWVRDLIITSEIRPGQLRLEITERVILEHTVLATHLLGALRDLGVQVQIDDFGLGYSSLISLHHFPFNALKLAREFLAGESATSTEIVRAIVALAHGLHLDVIAEGIEHEEQVKNLTDIGCEYGQGYYFSRPMAPSEVVTYLHACDGSQVA